MKQAKKKRGARADNSQQMARQAIRRALNEWRTKYRGRKPAN